MERDQYPLIIEGARKENILLCRIADSAYSGKKPFDIFGVLPNGRAIGIEVKQVASIPSNPISLLEDHQYAWLRAYAARDGIALLLIHIKGQKTMTVFKFLKNGNHQQMNSLVLYKNVWTEWIAMLTL